MEWLGRERALIFKTLVLTGLRKDELASLTFGQLQLDGATPHVILNPEDEKNRNGTSLPLPDDLANDLRSWVSQKRQRLLGERSTILMTARSKASELPSDTPLFNVPYELVKILDRDLKAAGIAKIDDRGRRLDVHALRTTFGTLLSQSGVSPRTAMSAMRHSSIDLTMATYTDPRLLDVQGAVNSLPTLSLTATQPDAPEVLRATGTESQLAPLLAPTSGNLVPAESFAVTSTTLSVRDDQPGQGVVSAQLTQKNRAVNENASLTIAVSEAFRVAPPRFELGLNDSESFVLPLHHGAVLWGISQAGTMRAGTITMPREPAKANGRTKLTRSVRKLPGYSDNDCATSVR